MSGSGDQSGFQFGGATVIPPDLALLVLDCYETLIELDGARYVPRRGIVQLLDNIGLVRGLPIAVVSDGEQATVEDSIAQAGLADRFAKVWGAPESLGCTPEGRMLKRLDLVPACFGVPLPRCVYIGDSPLDAEAAKYHGMPFIRVPRSEDRSFTFAKLIDGPSRYQSNEFSAVFLERYLGKKPKT